MTNIYYTADPHFLHARIIELCNRPFGSAEEMSQQIVDNYNSVATADDILVILGDVALGNLEAALEYVKQINAFTVLVPGNHDKCSYAYQRKGNRISKVEAAADIYRAAFDQVLIELFDKPSSFMSLGDFTGPYRPIMSHYPYIGDSHGDGNDRYGHLRPIDIGLPLIHGHVHGEWRTRDNMFNVGVDVNDFMPVSTEEINSWLATL